MFGKVKEEELKRYVVMSKVSLVKIFIKTEHLKQLKMLMRMQS